MIKIWTLIAVLSLTISCATSQSKPTDSEVRCSLAQFNEDPGALKLCQDDCAGGQAQACTSLGSMYSRGHLVPQSHADALTYTDKGCELGDATGCFYAGRLRNETDDQRVRVGSLERACREADLIRADKKFACYESATAYLNGFGVPVDKDRGVQLAEKACRAGSFRACDGDFSSPPVYADGGHRKSPDNEAGQAHDSQKNSGMTLNIRELTADGLTLRNLSCSGVKNGMGAGLMIVSALSQQKTALEACEPTRNVSLTWTVEGSTMNQAEATSDEEGPAQCVQTILAATPMPDGDCTATLPPQ